MPYVAEIVTKIDELIAASSLTDQRFQPRLMAGLVQQIPVVSTSAPTKTNFLPAKLNGILDATLIVPDDNYNLITYHRVITNTYSQKPGNQQYGDTYDYQLSTYDVIMIVIAFADKVLLTTEQLEALIVQNIPSVFDKVFIESLQMNSISSYPTSSTFDSVTIFSQEYGGDQYFMKPEMLLFQIRYKIEAAYKKGCFTICDDC